MSPVGSKVIEKHVRHTLQTCTPNGHHCRWSFSPVLQQGRHKTKVTWL